MDTDLLDEYTFFASGPNRHPEVSYLEFPTPTCPLVIPGIRPIITRQFQVEATVKLEATREATHRVNGDGQASSVQADSEWTPSSSSPMQPWRSGSVVSRSKTPLARHASRSSVSPTPSTHSIASTPPRTPAATPGPSGKANPVAPRSALRRSSSYAFPPDNFEDYLPPLKTGVLTRSASRTMAQASRASSRASSPANPDPVSEVSSSAGTVASSPSVPGYYKRNTRRCPLTTREKAAIAKSLAKGKGGESLHQQYTCWYESGGPHSEPLVCPPDLTTQDDLELGDLFCHYHGKRKAQLWLWSQVDDGSLVWAPIVPGQRREVDGRVISLTDTLRPSWIQDYWFSRNKVPNARGVKQFKPY
ncbi:hypothetical protein TRAPUB_8484 [Trametes pubescens]|uniref:Uncharacterized protein n=1 Tax=Trametes pubescens TaxID=154538 RepID=A0A1M2W504_TRAPU|nr:hypothetical protein TRAPUB_8484 [Trametes pubescens]